jgi:hypothetical protein
MALYLQESVDFSFKFVYCHFHSMSFYMCIKQLVVDCAEVYKQS